MLSIQLPSSPPHSPHPILNLGFRIFFVGAAVFAIISMVSWYLILQGIQPFVSIYVPIFYWHAHEMMYGYACAVIAGFLLTAVKTWTSQPMPYGWKLFFIFLPWVIARVCWLFVPINSYIWLILATVMDMAFWGMTTFFVVQPIVRVRQKRQIGIVAKLILLLMGQLLFYWGVWLGSIELQRIGLYFGLYLIIGVVLTIGRRVIPFFIERGVDEDVKVKNSALVDKLSLISFFIFMLVDISYPQPYLVSISGLAVAVINLYRLVGWHTQGIWSKPLLWSLYLAFLGMCLSFLLFAIQPWFGFTHSIAMHGLTLSGIGLMTLSMMARVSLGHTGRSVHQPPKIVGSLFALMILAFFTRVIFPIFWVEYYNAWIVISQFLWIISFLGFCIAYTLILAKPRTDGLFG